MVRRYFRFSIDSVILQLITILFVVGGLYFAVLSTRETVNEIIQGELKPIAIFATVVFYLGSFLFVYVELTFLIGNICLDVEKISVRGDIKYGREKLQYPTSIKYIDIANVEIVALKKNSKGQSALLSRPIPYLVITNKKGKKFRFGLHCMSKKTVKLLLEELLKKCEIIGEIQYDVDTLYREFLEARLAVK